MPMQSKNPNLQYPTNPTFSGKNNSTINIRTFEKGGVGHFNLSNFIIINLKCFHLSGPLEISYPQYLPNGDRLGKKMHHGDQNLQKWWGRSPQNLKKKPNFGGNTHVTLNLKPLN